MTLRTIIVDDEDLARKGIRSLLERAGDVDIIRECCNGREAIDAIVALDPQLVYLDIQMPGKTGFDVIDSVSHARSPHIVFVTAFDEFAIRAFEVHALDYLLKPVNEGRFNASLTRARAAVALGGEAAVIQRLTQFAAALREVGYPVPGSVPDRIPVKTQGRVVILPVADIDWVEAEHDYVALHVGQKSWLHRETIAVAEERLGHSGFVRIHRSVLVNVRRVRELRALSKGEFTVVLGNGTELKLSRNYRDALPRLVGEKL